MVRTVSDTKRSFYNHHNRPINSIYRRIVEELMVEMHLLSVNNDFRLDPIFCLGVVTSFDRFMQGYQPENDKNSIFTALCQSVGGNDDKYRQEAETVLGLGKRLSSVEDLVSWINSPTPMEGEEQLAASVQAIANNSHFKYSRLFAIGIYTVLEQIDPELVKDETKRNQALEQISNSLHINEEKLQKDLEIYRNNLEKMSQLLIVLADTLEADRKKREKRLEEKQDTPDATNLTTP